MLASSSASIGTDARAIQRKAASISGGRGRSRRGGLNAHLRSAFRNTAGSGAPRWLLTRTGVTAISPSASDTRPLAACLGQRASMNSVACSSQVTSLTSRAMESGSPESVSKASPRAAACKSRDLYRSASAFPASVCDFSRPVTVHRTV
jgi:hypothetical protein